MKRATAGDHLPGPAILNAAVGKVIVEQSLRALVAQNAVLGNACDVTDRRNVVEPRDSVTDLHALMASRQQLFTLLGKLFLCLDTTLTFGQFQELPAFLFLGLPLQFSKFELALALSLLRLLLPVPVKPFLLESCFNRGKPEIKEKV